MRGVVNGVLFSIPFWVGLVVAWVLYPPTTFGRIAVYAMVAAFIVLTMFAFLPQADRRPPDCDRYLLSLSPLEVQEQWEDDH